MGKKSTGVLRQNTFCYLKTCQNSTDSVIWSEIWMYVSLCRTLRGIPARAPRSDLQSGGKHFTHKRSLLCICLCIIYFSFSTFMFVVLLFTHCLLVEKDTRHEGVLVRWGTGDPLWCFTFQRARRLTAARVEYHLPVFSCWTSTLSFARCSLSRMVLPTWRTLYESCRLNHSQPWESSLQKENPFVFYARQCAQVGLYRKKQVALCNCALLCWVPCKSTRENM